MRGKKTGGRTRGTPNRVSATARDNIIAAFDGMGGVPALVDWARANPSDFYRIYARLLPIESHIHAPNESTSEVDLGRAKEILLGKLCLALDTGSTDGSANGSAE